MNHPSQEDLLGYVLGALDAQEQRDLQQQIDNDPSLEETLLDLKAALVPLDCMESPGYRPGLARRTCESVATWDAKSAASRLAFLDYTEIDWDEGCELLPNQIPAPANAVEPCSQNTGEQKNKYIINPVADCLAQESPSAEAADLPLSQLSSPADGRQLRTSSWSMRDMLVGVAALAVLAGLLFPALAYSRQQGRLLACQDNLGQLGMVFMSYSSTHEGGFVSTSKKASGSYAAILKESGLVTDDSLFACAGLGGDGAPVVIPSVAQVEAAETEAERAHYLKTMGGHYGYSMGFQDGDRYRSPRAGVADVILLADQPSSRSDRQSMNHGGDGQNCLFGDGRVMFVSGPAYGSDLIYENDRGIVGPGAHVLDSVIGPSHLAPTF